MSKNKKLTYPELIQLLKNNLTIHKCRDKNGKYKGYFIQYKYVYSNFFWNLKNQNAIEPKGADESGEVFWGVAENVDITKIKLKKIIKKCVICLKPFEQKGRKLTCSKKCQTIHHNQTVLTYQKTPTQKNRILAQALVRQKAKLARKKQIHLSTGCIITKYKIKNGTDNGRCDKYRLCKHSMKCLYEVPDHWNGFKCINNHIGFEYKHPEMKEDRVCVL